MRDALIRVSRTVAIYLFVAVCAIFRVRFFYIDMRSRHFVLITFIRVCVCVVVRRSYTL